MRARAFILAASLSTLPVGALAQPAPDDRSAVEMETARREFRFGVVAAQAGRWHEARGHFETTLALRPAPIIRFNLAVACQNDDNHLIEAIDHFRAFLRETSPEEDPTRVAAAAQQIDALGRRVARLHVQVTGDEVRTFTLDGRSMNVALVGVDIPVNPGPHRVEVVGAAGDRQVRDGGSFEGDSITVPIELSRTPPSQHAAADWQPRARTFGRTIARPGPDGRWIDWAARATAAPVSLWRQRPFTVGLQLAYGAPTGALSVSFRYFPQPWFGVELAAGYFGAYGPSGAAIAHLRYPGERFAIGAFTGLGAGLTRATTSCTPRDPMNASCPAASTRDVSAFALTVSAGLSAELRLGSRFTLRGIVGARVLTNPADLRAMDDLAARPDCEGGSVDGEVCALYQRDAQASTVNALVGIDVGYTF